jgi:hypothetical protein
MRKIKGVACLLSLGIFLIHHVNAQDLSQPKTVVLDYRVDLTDDIEILAYETTLELETWQKQEVQVTAELVYKGTPNKRVTTFYENFEQIVRDQIYQSTNRLEINTQLKDPDKINVGIGPVSILQVGYGDKELSIRFNIKLPENNDLSVNNRYGDMQLNGSYNGEVSIEHYSGELKVETIKGDAMLSMKYGQAEINSLGNAEIKIYEQELEVGRAKEIEMDSKYSDLVVGSIEFLRVYDYEGNWSIGDIQSLTGEMKYTDIKKSDRVERMDLRLYETDIELKEVGSLMFPESKYGEYEIGSIGKLVLMESYEDEFSIGSLGELQVNGKYGEFDISSISGKVDVNGYENEIKISRLDGSFEEIRMDGKYYELELASANIPFQIDADITYGSVTYQEDRMERMIYIKEGNKLKLKAKPKSAPDAADLPLIYLRGYDCKVRL